ncbi:MAG TPA: hypothetical protein DDY13_07280 [Cytophagales bacterium]|nr:hypothetical protein [Cytophagales bacterium]
MEWFKRDTGNSLNPEMIDEDWLNYFVDWLTHPHEIVHNDKIRRSDGLNEGTVWKYIKDLKKFMSIAEMAFDKETKEKIYRINPDYKEFKISHGYESRNNTPLYLSKEELKQISRLDLRAFPGLDKTRDWLMIACLSGQRYSDWHKITPDNVRVINGEERIILKQEKTGTEVKIPINPTIKMIWSKYPDGLKLDTEQVTNRKLKELCFKAGIDEVISHDITGNKEFKWQKISTHIGRRSLCTNMYLEKIPIILIMEISGHKSDTELMKYVRMSDDFKQRELGRQSFFTEAI